MRLSDIAPRLALARDQWIVEERRRLKYVSRAEVKAERQAVAADGRAKCKTTGKLRYRTQQSAEHQLAHLLLRVPLQRPCRAYPCDFCGGWHLTSKSRRRVAA